MLLDDRPRLTAARARSQAIARGWRAGRAHCALAAVFDAVDPGDAEALADAAHGLFVDCRWIEDLLAPLIAALVADPLFEPPFKLARDALRTSVVLYEGAGASLVATVLSADALAALPPPVTVALSGRLSVVRYVRAGGARLRTWRAPAPAADLVVRSTARRRLAAIAP